jgi:hypothetical protein
VLKVGAFRLIHLNDEECKQSQNKKKIRRLHQAHKYIRKKKKVGKK